MNFPENSDLHIQNLKDFSDDRGSLVAITGGQEISFRIARVFYTYNNSPSIQRGAHAHRTCFQYLICISGSMCVTTFDGKSYKEFNLKKPTDGLLIPPLIWSYQHSYSPNAVCLVLASEEYSRTEYVYSLEEFKNLRRRA